MKIPNLAQAVSLLFAIGLAPLAVASTTDFEGFLTNTSVNYQGPGSTTVTLNGYTIPDPYGSLWTVADEWGFTGSFDEEVVDNGGNTVWRLSNAVTAGGYSNQPNSPSSPAVAGESTAFLYNDHGDDHTLPDSPPNPRAGATTPYYHGGFQFKSATGAAQPGLFVSINPIPRQTSYRMSYVGIEDTGAGLDLIFFDTSPGGSFDLTTITTGLSYTDWHQVDIYVEFVDGLNGDGSGNDVVTVLVNGAVAHTGTTWESYFAENPGSFPSPIAVDALLFRVAGTAAAGILGNGLFFDNVVSDNAAYSTAETYACSGFQAPLDKEVVIKKPNRVLPLRMNLLDGDGNPVSAIAPPVVNVEYFGTTGGSSEILDELTYAGKGSDGNQFVYNDEYWGFNLSTKGLASGTYIITAVSGDLDEYIIDPTCEAIVVID